MKNCNTCTYFWKHNFNDGRKGLCEATDTTPLKMEGKSCKHYKSKKYNRLSTTHNSDYQKLNLWGGLNVL